MEVSLCIYNEGRYFEILDIQEIIKIETRQKTDLYF
jgi:hypothetical protein